MKTVRKKEQVKKAMKKKPATEKPVRAVDKKQPGEDRVDTDFHHEHPFRES